MSNYKVGDLIRSKVDESYITKGNVYRIAEVASGGLVCVLDDANFRYWLSSSDIEPVTKSLDNLQAGDVLVNAGSSSSRIVQGTMGETVFYVYDSGDRSPSFASTTQLKKYGWKLKDPEETREMTVKEVEELVGQKVKIVKEKE